MPAIAAVLGSEAAPVGLATKLAPVRPRLASKDCMATFALRTMASVKTLKSASRALKSCTSIAAHFASSARAAATTAAPSASSLATTPTSKTASSPWPPRMPVSEPKKLELDAARPPPAMSARTACLATASMRGLASCKAALNARTSDAEAVPSKDSRAASKLAIELANAGDGSAGARLTSTIGTPPFAAALATTQKKANKAPPAITPNNEDESAAHVTLTPRLQIKQRIGNALRIATTPRRRWRVPGMRNDHGCERAPKMRAEMKLLQHRSGRWPARSVSNPLLMHRNCSHRLSTANARHILKTIDSACLESTPRNLQARCTNLCKMPSACSECQNLRPIRGDKARRSPIGIACMATRRGICLTIVPWRRQTNLRTHERHRRMARDKKNLARTYPRLPTQIAWGMADRSLARTTRRHDAFPGPKCGPRAERWKPIARPAAA